MQPSPRVGLFLVGFSKVCIDLVCHVEGLSMMLGKSPAFLPYQLRCNTALSDDLSHMSSDPGPFAMHSRFGD
jgi:hypothetical protein